MLQDFFKKAKYITVPSARRQKEPAESDLPAHLWEKCPKCSKNLLRDEYESALKVCLKCGHHARLSAKERLQMTVDPGTFREYDAELQTLNPLTFEGYSEKIAALKETTGSSDAILTGQAEILSAPVAIGVMDSNFLMASMGSVVGEKVTRLFERAGEEKLPVILFIASGGARMQEGIFSLMQMAKASGAAGKFSEEGGLYIPVLTDPTTGGVTASFAMLGDIIAAEPGATVGFAGRRVIEGTISEKLPPGFQTAEFQLDHGFVDLLIDRREMRKKLKFLLQCHEKGGEA